MKLLSVFNAANASEAILTRPHFGTEMAKKNLLLTADKVALSIRFKTWRSSVIKLRSKPMATSQILLAKVLNRLFRAQTCKKFVQWKMLLKSQEVYPILQH